VNDRALVGRQFGNRHLLFLGNRIEQNLACLRTGHAQRHEIAWHRHARGRDLRAVEQIVRIAVDLRIAGANSVFTFDQSASSSSASISGNDV